MVSAVQMVASRVAAATEQIWVPVFNLCESHASSVARSGVRGSDLYDSQSDEGHNDA